MKKGLKQKQKKALETIRNIYEEERLNCVYYHNEKCPVREEMHSVAKVTSIIKPLEKLGSDGFDQIFTETMEFIRGAGSTNLHALSQFCKSCLYKYSFDNKIKK